MSAQLSIQRLNATYLVPRGLPDVGAARYRLDGAMRRRLGATCQQFLAQVLDDADPSVWVIRRLDLDLALDAGVVDEDLLTRTWASRIVASLARTITRGPDGQSVIRFPNRAAYLAHFLRDLAEGSAWQGWQYDSLETLRSLPPSAAMREALVREPEHTENVLLHLARSGWLDQVLALMTEGDVLRVYEACVNDAATFSSEDEERRITRALLAIWHDAVVRVVQSRIAHAHNVLRLYVALRLKSPDVGKSGVLTVTINHLLGFAEILRRIDKPEALLSTLSRGKLSEAIQQARAAGATSHLESLPFIERVAGGDETWLSELAQGLSANVPAVLSNEKKVPPRIISSWCGGLFLLVPAMLDLNLHRLIESAPYSDSEEWTKEQSLRYLLFLKICNVRTLDAAYDFVPRFLAGFDELPSLANLHDFSRAATAEMNQACLWLLLEELVRLGRADGNILAAELISRGKDEVLLLRDIANDAWVYAARCGEALPQKSEISVGHSQYRNAVASGQRCGKRALVRNDPTLPRDGTDLRQVRTLTVEAKPCGDDTATIRETIERGLQMVRQATGNSPACLLVEKNLEARLEVETLASRFVRTIPAEQVRLLSRPSGDDELPSVWTAGAGELPQQVKEMLRLYLSRRRPAAKELAYFSLTDREPAIVADEDFDLVWSLVARALMKEFAHRLMNFGWSSAEYLAQNFLEGSSTLVVESGRVDVRLARVPLHIMLRIAGLDEQSYTVPWLNDTQVTLSLMPE